MLGRRTVIIGLVFMALTAAEVHADHERFVVGGMQNVDPSTDILTSTSGACVPSHDRERLECYFTSFGLWKVTKEENLKKDFEAIEQEINKDPAKQMRELKKSFCDDKKVMEPDPIRLKYNVWAKSFHGAVKAFVSTRVGSRR